MTALKFPYQMYPCVRRGLRNARTSREGVLLDACRLLHKMSVFWKMIYATAFIACMREKNFFVIYFLLKAKSVFHCTTATFRHVNSSVSDMRVRLPEVTIVTSHNMGVPSRSSRMSQLLGETLKPQVIPTFFVHSRSIIHRNSAINIYCLLHYVYLLTAIVASYFTDRAFTYTT